MSKPVVTQGMEWSGHRDDARAMGVNFRHVPMIRRSSRSQNGWNNGDLDVAFQLFSCGMVADGNLTSKESRTHLTACGYAVRYDGMQALTGKGVVAFLTTPAVWRSAWRRWRLWGRNPFVATPEQVHGAMR